MFQNNVKNIYIGDIENIMSICEAGGRISYYDSVTYKAVVIKEIKDEKGTKKVVYREAKTDKIYEELNDAAIKDNVVLLTPVEEYYNQDGTKKLSKRFKKESRPVFKMVDECYKKGWL